MTICSVPPGGALPRAQSHDFPCVLPQVLLVEDDPVSRSFLAAAVTAIPAVVDSAASVSDALALAMIRTYDLWLFDAQLPDGTGAELLARLRRQHPHVPALAHTACNAAAVGDALLAAGFDLVLVKPLSAASLRTEVLTSLRMGAHEGAGNAVADPPARRYGEHPLPIWDDLAAARALGGNAVHVQAMRALFLKELPQARREVLDAIGSADSARAGGQLHKLRASCGFVGAHRLGHAVHALQRDLDDATLAAKFGLAAAATAAQVMADDPSLDQASLDHASTQASTTQAVTPQR